MLEAMAEKQVTIGKETFPMPKPFFVLATENPIETTGTYPLPEAQMDRFIFKLKMAYPSIEEERKILNTNIQVKHFDEYDLVSVAKPEKIIEMQRTVKDIYLSGEVEQYIVELVDATRNPGKYGIELGHYIAWGASPRASIFLFISSKANALLRGDTFVTPAHIKDVAHNILRHRMILNYEGMAENIDKDEIINEILSKVPVP